jgi:hypothetical protein
MAKEIKIEIDYFNENEINEKLKRELFAMEEN